MAHERAKKIALLSLLAAAACTKHIPLRDEWRVGSAAELATRMRAAAAPLASYSAEVRLTYFGPQGRVKGTASIAALRPASLRYEVQGPHGGVVEAFATNGAELALVDFKNNRFLHGPATVANLDRLLSWAPLGMSAEEWVGLFFGDVAPRADSELSYDDSLGRFVLRWDASGLTRRLEVDPQTSRVARAQVVDRDTLVSDVEVSERDERGVPLSLHLRVPRAEVDVEVRLRDVTHDAELDASVFVLDPPRGAEVVHLEAAAR